MIPKFASEPVTTACELRNRSSRSMRRARARLAMPVLEASRAGDLVGRRAEIDFGRITPWRAVRIAFEEAGRADRGLPWICGKITREESIVGKVAVVVAGVERPAAGVAVTERTRAIIIACQNRRDEDKRREHGKRHFS